MTVARDRWDRSQESNALRAEVAATRWESCIDVLGKISSVCHQRWNTLVTHINVLKCMYEKLKSCLQMNYVDTHGKMSEIFPCVNELREGDVQKQSR